LKCLWLRGEAAENDLSNLSYTEAFDALVKDLRIRYTFNGLQKYQLGCDCF